MTSEPRIPLVRLNDGADLPQLGLGVWQVDAGVAERVVSQALETGYRHIDTAAIYGNEAEVGRAIAASGIPREELFITTKLWNTEHERAKALAAFDASLERLGLDYVDLYLIHWPVPSENRYVEVWHALEEIKASGRARSIGVSNFLIPHLERLLAETSTVPAVNQIELHPTFIQQEARDFHAAHGIVTEAWGPLGQGKYDLGDLPAIAEAAAAHGKTPAQVVIRWHLQHGIVVFPKTVNADRMRENIDVFDFELSEAEMAAIDALDRGNRQGRDPATT